MLRMLWATRAIQRTGQWAAAPKGMIAIPKPVRSSD